MASRRRSGVKGSRPGRKGDSRIARSLFPAVGADAPAALASPAGGSGRRPIGGGPPCHGFAQAKDLAPGARRISAPLRTRAPCSVTAVGAAACPRPAAASFFNLKCMANSQPVRIRHTFFFLSGFTARAIRESPLRRVGASSAPVCRRAMLGATGTFPCAGKACERGKPPPLRWCRSAGG